jgi:large-conductance mechanosensitive channel
VSAQWSYWLEYNIPFLAITLALAVWAARLWARQFRRTDAAIATQRENSETLRRMVTLLEEIRDQLKGKS